MKKTIEKAILPLNHARVTAGYKNPSYAKKMGFKHYGIDMADRSRECVDVYAPFKMKIVKVGDDNVMGKTLIAVSIHSIDVHNGPKKGSRPLTLRLAHLAKVHVEEGDVVVPEGAKIADYGSTGIHGNSPHLHVELDTDVKHPTYSPTLARSSNIWKAGKDTTINPMDVFKVDSEGERGYEQSLTHAKSSGSWVLDDDKTTLGLNGKVITGKGV